LGQVSRRQVDFTRAPLGRRVARRQTRDRDKLTCERGGVMLSRRNRC
jgi:hypothetical protein